MSTPHGFIERLAELSKSGAPFVSVTMVEAVGSTPQDAGTKMLVDRSGLAFGTVGGGKVENQAIQFAKQMLGEKTTPAGRLVEWNLQRDVGMTCGGVVKLYFEAFNHQAWRIVVFGAGHVAQARPLPARDGVPARLRRPAGRLAREAAAVGQIAESPFRHDAGVRLAAHE
jgi:xanthine dehydrogenase accessory factor